MLLGPVLSVEAGGLLQDVVSYWQFDEPNGTTVYDPVGDNDGTIHNATPTTGQVGGALSFDGNEDYVEVPSSVSFDSTTATWSLWVKPTGDPGGSGSSLWVTVWIMSRGDSWGTWNGVHISLMPHATYGTIAIQVKANANPSVLVEDTVFSSPDITYNDWSHIAFVFDSGNYAELYVNGALTVNYTLGNFAFNNQVLRIATSTDTYLYDFNGEVDEVVIHDRALSAEEVQQLYELGLSGNGLPIDVMLTLKSIQRYLDQKLQALEAINEALQIEYDIYDALDLLLQSSAYTNSEKREIEALMRDIAASIRGHEREKEDIEKSIEKLQNALAALDANAS